jgi:DNA replication protein DnaC
MEQKQSETLDSYLSYLDLHNLHTHWDRYLKEAAAKKCSYQHLLTTIITDEYQCRFERRRLARIKAAKIPELLVMESFPFDRQPNLKKKMVLELYESMRFLTENQVLVFIGPTGCGKTGLGTSYLIHAINNGCRGCFFDCNDLVDLLYSSVSDHGEKRLIRKLAAIDCLLIDELGYSSLDKVKAGLLFDLMKHRHKKSCTIITSQLGFDEWGSFVNDAHLTAALLDRITENCTVFNMTKCISIRPKRIAYAAEKAKS